MLALLICEDRECRAAFEAEGSPEAIRDLVCEDCGGRLRAVGYADARPGSGGHGGAAEVRRAA